MGTERIEKTMTFGGRKRTGRRRFLAIGGGAALAIAAGGVVLASTPEVEPASDWARCECAGPKNGSLSNQNSGTEAKKVGKVLVAYASRCGSTGEIAAAIGEELCAVGAEVVVRPVGEVESLAGYDALVLGSATRMGKLMPEATSFLKKNASALGATRVAYFSAGIGPLEPDAEKREKETMRPLAEWRSVREPDAARAFAGKVDHLKLGFPWKQMLAYVKEGPMADGDHRDWDAIRAWAREIAPSLQSA